MTRTHRRFRPSPGARRRLVAPAAALGALFLAFASVGTAAATAGQHDQINGSGSSWAANAVNQWVADVANPANGNLKVVFTSEGSAQGRKDFANVTNDFAVSDIGYQGTDSSTGASDTSQGRSYAYLPIVAGGTSFPYQLKVAGQLKTNLRLSAVTLAKIFTNQITNWNDPAITADNNGSVLPSIPIVPVVHQEGSGSTYQFTKFLDTNPATQSIWRNFAQFSGGTEYFPRAGSQIAGNGSDGIITYITAPSSNGAIGYDEYSYALAKGFPVAKVENSAGFFNLPTQYNVAVALTKAAINMDTTSPNYLLQDLTNVYSDPDPRTYPLSSYSYAVIPTSATDSRMTTAKRQTIADYLDYSVCGGQKEIGPIGYSPLPINLVQASFAQVQQLQTADPNVDVTQANVNNCQNPTFVPGDPSGNYLAQTAPQPAACDQAGMGPCGASASDANNAPVVNPAAGGTKAAAAAAATTKGKTAVSSSKTPVKTTATTSSAKGTTAAPAAGAAAATSTTATSGGSAAGTAPAAAVDPATGLATGAVAPVIDPATGATSTGAAADGSSAGNAQAAGTPTATTLADASNGSSPAVFGGLAALVLIVAILAPPLVSSRLRRRSAGGLR